MVHFGAKLQMNKHSKWAAHYVDYDGLKKLIKKVARRMDSIRSASIQALERDVRQNKTKSVRGASPSRSGRQTRSMTEEESSLLLDRRRQERVSASPEYGAMTSHSSDQAPKLGSEEDKNMEGLDLPTSLMVLHDNPDEEFVSKVKQEANKVEAFYQEQMHELRDRVRRLRTTLRSLNNAFLSLDPDVEEDSAKLPKEALTADSARRAFRDVYRELKFLENFAIINYTAFVKIFKKHDKATGLRTMKNMTRHIQKFKTGFVEAPELLALMESVEEVVANAFHGGNRTMARSDLMLKHHQLGSWEMMHLGLRVGMVLVLCMWVIWDVSVDFKLAVLDERSLMQMDDTLRVFRGFGFFVFWLWLWPLCLYVWTSDRVNYIYLFEFDPRRSLLWEEALGRATTVTIIFLFMLLGYVKVTLGAMGSEWLWTAKYFPVVLFVYMCTILVFPLEQTSSVLDALVKVMVAPLHEVTFFQSFVADVLTSMAKPLVDVAFTVCFFFSGDWHRVFDTSEPLDKVHTCSDSGAFLYGVAPAIIALPLLFRIFQNLRRYADTGKRSPHLLNACKYFLAQQVVLLGALHPKLQDANDDTLGVYRTTFIAALVGSSLFTYLWDVRMDWGIRTLRGPHLRGMEDPPTQYPPQDGGDPPASAARPRSMLLSEKRIYWFALVADFFLRFAWALTLIPSKVLNKYIDSAHLVFFLGSVELLRRAMWCIIRVEYEHAYNEQEYRRVELVPALFEQDAVINRQQRTSSKSTVFAELGVFSTVVVFFFVYAFATQEDTAAAMAAAAAGGKGGGKH